MSKAILFILLAIGLLLSVGILSSQDKYPQKIAEKQQDYTQSDFVAPSPWETTTDYPEVASSENSPEEATMAMPTSGEELESAFDSVVSVDSYQIVQSPAREDNLILCYWRGQNVARLIFRDNAGYSIRTKDGVDLIFPSNEFNDVVTTLREEARIGIAYRDTGHYINGIVYGAIIAGPSQIGQ
jgi:hypothetical protein